MDRGEEKNKKTKGREDLDVQGLTLIISLFFIPIGAVTIYASLKMNGLI